MKLQEIREKAKQRQIDHPYRPDTPEEQEEISDMVRAMYKPQMEAMVSLEDESQEV